MHSEETAAAATARTAATAVTATAVTAPTAAAMHLCAGSASYTGRKKGETLEVQGQRRV